MMRERERDFCGRNMHFCVFRPQSNQFNGLLAVCVLSAVSVYVLHLKHTFEEFVYKMLNIVSVDQA